MPRARDLALLLPLFVIGSMLACSKGTSHAPAPAKVGRAESAIIHGFLDKTHPAVVALLLGKDADSFEGTCTGTIVKRDVEHHIGWVATAAHCTARGVSLVVQAEDFTSTDAITYAVLDHEADPRYAKDNTYDFAVVRIVGVDASTPEIPLTTAPDGLVPNAPVTSVGFGVTTVGESNSQRYAIDKKLFRVEEELLVYDQESSGVCFGDSGGPVIAGSGKDARVVGIHSFVSPGDCMGTGSSWRVTTDLDFFDAQLNKPPPKPSCGLCEKTAKSGAGTCALLTSSCLGDDDCRGYYECIGDAKKTSTECFTEYTLAEGPFTAATSCVCEQACADECAGSPSCAGVGKCGAKLNAENGDACIACIESTCCEEERGCTADGRCHLCLKRDDSFSSCKTNDKRQALAACARDKCSAECAGTTLQTIGAPSPADAGADAGAPPPPVAEASGCTIARSVRPPSCGWGAAAGLLALALAFASRRRATRTTTGGASPTLRS
ncbi:MAG: trypsin-like serine protease [Labilithrix sp.]